jgi:hypothetical protein
VFAKRQRLQSARSQPPRDERNGGRAGHPGAVRGDVIAVCVGDDGKIGPARRIESKAQRR